MIIGFTDKLLVYKLLVFIEPIEYTFKLLIFFVLLELLFKILLEQLLLLLYEF